MGGLPGDAERLQPLRARAFRNRVRNIDDRLRRLPDRAGRDHLVGERIDRGQPVGIFQADIDPAAVARRPDAVRQFSHRNGRDLRKIVGAKHLDLVQPADRDIGERALAVGGKIDVIADRPGFERFQHRKRRLGVEHHGPAGILQRHPDLLAVGRRRDVRTERAVLLDVADDLVIGDRDHDGLRIERRTDVAVFAVRREDRHARSGRHLDARLLLERLAVDHRDVILAAHGDPDFAAIGREERLMRRAAEIGGVLYRVGRGIDEGHRVRTDRDHRQRRVIERKAHAMDQHLALVERA